MRQMVLFCRASGWLPGIYDVIAGLYALYQLQQLLQESLQHPN